MKILTNQTTTHSHHNLSPQYNWPSIPRTRIDTRSNRKTRSYTAAEGGCGPLSPPPPGLHTAKTSKCQIPNNFKITFTHKPKFLQDPGQSDLLIPSTLTSKISRSQPITHSRRGDPCTTPAASSDQAVGRLAEVIKNSFSLHKLEQTLHPPAVQRDSKQ